MVPDDVAASEKSAPVLRTLADKVNWLIDRAHPAGCGPFSNNEVADLITKATGEDVSYTTIWKLLEGDPPVPGGPAADLVLVQAGQAISGLDVLLDGPAQPGDRDQRGQGDRARAPATVKGQFAGTAVAVIAKVLARACEAERVRWRSGTPRQDSRRCPIGWRCGGPL